jgi:predicted Fe-S protein YdhL (DUF1289 family)
LKRAIAIALLLLLACARTSATREQWQQMSDEEKTLYVRSLLGHEKAAERKGGNDRAYDRPPQEYVAKIDEAYARGEQRGVDELFASLGRPH